MDDGMRDVNRDRVFTNAVNLKHAELFAKGKPIHPYSLVYPASRLARNPG